MSEKSLSEILATAMEFEKTARSFYADLAGKVAKPLRELVTELADEEARHYRLFADLQADADVAPRLKSLIAVPETDHGFADYIVTPDLGAHPDDQAVLQYALGREQAAAQHYADLAAATPEGAIRDLFRYLADEELRHKGALEKRYYEIVHSGGV